MYIIVVVLEAFQRRILSSVKRLRWLAGVVALAVVVSFGSPGQHGNGLTLTLNSSFDNSLWPDLIFFDSMAARAGYEALPLASKRNPCNLSPVYLPDLCTKTHSLRRSYSEPTFLTTLKILWGLGHDSSLKLLVLSPYCFGDVLLLYQMHQIRASSGHRIRVVGCRW